MEVMQKDMELPLQKAVNRAVKLACLLNRYVKKFFGNTESSHKEKKVLIYYGEVKSETDSLLGSIVKVSAGCGDY